MKIPTLIGIALILALLGSLGFWIFIRATGDKSINFTILDLQIANISGTSATIIWQTTTPTFGQVYFGEDENLDQKAGDNRDFKKPSERMTHFVTLKNLKTNTRFYYKIANNLATYPEKHLEFQTANIKDIDDLNFSFIKPLKGTILNPNLNPIDESLIFLEIPGVSNLATFSSTAGNFILPLKVVLSKDLNQIFNIPPDTQATLTIKKGSLESKVKLVISESTMNLPPVTIGSNLDLSSFIQPPLTTISIGSNTKRNIDFNLDGKINSLDLAILRGKAVSKTFLSPDDRIKFDINSDGVVDQQDIDIFSISLIRT